jgi:hypothetical protein
VPISDSRIARYFERSHRARRKGEPRELVRFAPFVLRSPAKQWLHFSVKIIMGVLHLVYLYSLSKLFNSISTTSTRNILHHDSDKMHRLLFWLLQGHGAFHKQLARRGIFTCSHLHERMYYYTCLASLSVCRGGEKSTTRGP